MRILVVPDKFKGTLTAAEAGEAIRAGWGDARPGDEIAILPMSDGGDGFGEILGTLIHAREVAVETINAAHQPGSGKWWWNQSSATAVFETAEVIGLAMLPPGRFHPFDLDTFGLGKVFRCIQEKEVSSVVVGIGGSATNDGGFGLGRSLGHKFLDGRGNEITRWTELDQLDRVEPPAENLALPECVIATDVQNQLLGSEGATRVYGPQKGLKAEDFELAERSLARLAEVIARDFRVDARKEPGTGAAGGLGYGLRVFLNGRFEPGFDIFARFADLKQRVREVDLVITAEGAIDRQSMMGKGTGAVAKICAEAGKRCIGLSGTLDRALLSDGTSRLFTSLHGMHPELTSREEAKAQPAHWLRRLSSRAAAEV